MLGIHDYWLFVLTGVLLNLTPGQDTMFILGRSLTGGLRAGVASALGIGVGSLFHTFAVAAGLSAILAASPAAFLIVRIAGALYLVYLGARLLFTTALQDSDLSVTPVNEGNTGSAFRQGIVTNVLNPKVALFFLALLPQFIEPDSASKTLAFLTLGLTFVMTGTLWCLVLALGAARLRQFFRGNPRMRTTIDRVTGGLFIALGIRLAADR
ncbi:MAG TPA: LysE family translocator [Vicinamibacterales bacterium]|nr:LysE family translocator [Vicinamibacterales bacterium]